ACIEDDNQRDLFTKHVKCTNSERGIRNMLELAKPDIAVSPAEFDADPFLINLENGVLDSRTGRLVPHARKFMMTKTAPTKLDEKAKCPTFQRFMSEIFNNNRNLINYEQRCYGYACTGDVREQKLFLKKGFGANGKSTLDEVIRSLLGTYSGVARSEIF